MIDRNLSVVLTGATGSVGRALARRLVVRGARVLLVARDAASLASLASELGAADEHRQRVDALVADVTTPAGRLAVRDAAVARNANALVNAASALRDGPLGAMAAAEIETLLQTNLVAPVQLTRALLPHLLGLPEARVLNIGSSLGRVGLPGHAALSAGSFGLRGFTEALRRELGSSPVRVQLLTLRGVRRGGDSRDALTNEDLRPQHAANVAMHMLLAGTAERHLGLLDTALAHANRLAPRWLDAFLKRRAARHGARDAAAS